MGLLVRFLSGLLGIAMGAVEASIFYLIVDRQMGLTVTWPLALAVAFVMYVHHTRWAVQIAKEEGLL